tara:strand:+ start:1471 stop:3972 length:2502 start_codon:yes stop_codon:yes gene_type:complete
MAGTRITSFNSLDSGSLSPNDTFLVVDVSDHLYSPNGTNKKTDLASILASPINPIKRNLIELEDTPTGYGEVGQVLKVGSDGQSLVFENDIFSTLSGSGSSNSFQTGNFVLKTETGNFGGATNFAELSDTPSVLSGESGKFVYVSGSQLAFREIETVVDNTVTYDYTTNYIESGVSEFLNLSDTPNFYGGENQFISFSGDGLVFKSLPTGDFLTSGDLQNFNFSNSDLTGYLTSGQIEENFLRKTDSSGFVTQDQIQDFITDDQIEDFVTDLDLLNYVQDSELVNYVTHNQTGDFVTNNQTGNFVTPQSLSNLLSIDASGNSTVTSGDFHGSILGKDTFYGDGVTQSFSMSHAPENSYSIIVSLNGLIQSPQGNYSLSNNNSGIVFSEPIPNGMEVDIRHVGGMLGSSVKGYDTFISDGSTSQFDLSYASDNEYSLIVCIGGLLQSSQSNYYLSSNNSRLNFYEPVPFGLEIDVRHLGGPVMVGGTTNIVANTSSFTSLLDTPSSYSQENKLLITTSSGIEYSGADFKTNFSDLLDTPSGINSEGQVLVTSGGQIAFSGLTITNSFIDLEDTPSQLGEEGQVLTVFGSGLSFSGIGEIKSNFLELLDTPANYPQEEKVLTANQSGISYSNDLVRKSETGNFLKGSIPTSENEGQFISVDSQGDLIYSEISQINDYSYSYDYRTIYAESVNTGALYLTGLRDTPDSLPQDNQILSYSDQQWSYKTLEDSAVSKAWVSFKYTPSGASSFSYDSFNVNNINRIEKGKYSVNFSNSFSSSNYCFNGNGYSNDSGWPVSPSKSSSEQNSNSMFYVSVKSGQELVDPTEDYVHLSFFSD